MYVLVYVTFFQKMCDGLFRHFSACKCLHEVWGAGERGGGGDNVLLMDNNKEGGKKKPNLLGDFPS